MSSGNKALAADAIANNADLLTEILVCLPVKSLVRFKFVSKHWESLISSPQFCRCLYPDSHKVSGLLILHKRSNLINPEHDFVPLRNETIGAPFKSLTFVNHPSGLRILQSCRGLLFCSSLRNKKFDHDYYIFNPTTKQFVELPQPGGRVYGINIAYDPEKSLHYKVVCLRGSDSSGGNKNDFSSYQIELYSSETRSWRVSGDAFTRHIGMQYENGVFWNGVIHWINCHDTSLYFKVDEEQLGEMPMPTTQVPDDWISGRRFRYLGETREHLYLVEIYDPCATKFVVYEMEQDYSRWFVKYRVDLDGITVAFPEMISSILCPPNMDYYRFSIICIIREANEAESYMVLHIPGKVIRYNFNDKTFDKICDFGSGHDQGIRYWASLVEWVDVYQYIESLAWVP